MKVYLAGPMSGIEQNNAPAFFAAQERLEKMGLDVFCPPRADLDRGINLDQDCTPEIRHECLRFDFDVILHRGINAVVLLPGWQGSRGALTETAIAFSIGISVYEMLDNSTLTPLEEEEFWGFRVEV